MQRIVSKIKQRPILIICAAIFVVLTSATITYTYFSRTLDKQITSYNQAGVLAAQDRDLLNTTPPEDLKTLNILLLGYGGAGHQGGSLSDVIQLVHLDFERSILAMISLPRDLWVKQPNGQSSKINSVFAADAKQGNNNRAPLTKSTVSAITGLPVDYFIAVDFVGFQRAIGEELGGIEVEVSEALDDPWYPIQGNELETCGMTPQEVAETTASYSGFELERQFPCRYEHLMFEPGTVHMEGGDALKFVRSRHGSKGGDFSRSKRQQAVLLAIKEKLFSLEVLNDAPGFLKQIAHTISTDIDEGIIKYLTPALRSTKDFQTVRITLSTENVFSNSKSSGGGYIVIPRAGLDNWKEIHSYIQSELTK